MNQKMVRLFDKPRCPRNLHSLSISLIITLSLWSVATQVLSWGGLQYGGMRLAEAFPDPRVSKLIEAVLAHDWDEASAQLSAGADPNYLGTEDIRPLVWVIWTEYRKSNYPATEYLLTHGANPNLRDADGYSVTYFAAGGENPDMLDLILRHGGDPNILNERDDAVLFTAVGQFREKNIELLLRAGADLNWHRANGDTVANFAVGMGRFDWAAMFLERGLNHDLPGLARSVQTIHVPPESVQMKWKQAVISMLKDRGVEIPKEKPTTRPTWFDTIIEMHKDGG